MPSDPPPEVAPARTGPADEAQDVEAARVRAKVRQGLFGGQAEPVRIERFEILRRLGAGAMGVVYEARDTELDRVVALKLLHPAWLERGGADATAALLDEARAMARVRHPNVLTVHQVGTHENQVFIAMERANLTLREWLEQQRPPPERVLEVLLATGRGLSAVHRQGLVHRDFKPDNVLMDAEGQPRVSDFGLALSSEAAATGSIAGTPAYMAPEQLRGDEVDARSDQFSYAVAALEAFTGQRPFRGESREELLEAMLARVPRSSLGSSLPPGVAPILLRALEPEPQARFPSMDALLTHLELGQRKGPGRPLLWVLAGGAAVALGAALLFSRRAKPAPPVTTPSREPAPVVSSAPAPIRNVTRLCVSGVRASSEQPEHPARHAFDGIVATAWSESSPGDGAGEWLEAELRPGTWVSSVEVSGGWPATTSAGADLWAINSTFRVMRISWDGGEAEVRFDRETDRGKRKQVRIEAETRRIRITAAEVDRGRFRDLCLDEVAIFGRCPRR